MLYIEDLTIGYSVEEACDYAYKELMIYYNYNTLIGNEHEITEAELEANDRLRCILEFRNYIYRRRYKQHIV